MYGPFASRGARFASLPQARPFSSVDASSDSTQPKQEEKKSNKKGSILDVGNASKHCADNVKKFDYYAFRVGQHMPKNLQVHYYTINSFFLEVLKSREISRERSICQTRLHWWASTLDDIEKGRTAREPVARMLQELRA